MARLLVVEDDADQAGIRKLLLESAGHEVILASTAREALGALAESHPQTVVMDLRLPLLEDGLELIRELHAQPEPPRIIVLSGYEQDLAGRPEAAMVDRVLGKPVPSELLIRLLRQR